MTAAAHTSDATEAATYDHALVRAGALLCALPHHTAAARPCQLRRIVPWRAPTPIPGIPAGLILGVAPLASVDDVEHVEVVVDLAIALGQPCRGGEPMRPRGACILTYGRGDLVAGFAVDALIGRVRLAPQAGTPDSPWSGTILAPEGDDPSQLWHVVDVNGLMEHLVAALHAPAAAGREGGVPSHAP